MRLRDRFGRPVDLSDERWREIITVRQAVADKQDGVATVLSELDMVTEDRAGSPRHHYYRRSWYPAPYERGYLKVTIQPSWLIPLFGSGKQRIITHGIQEVLDVAFVSSLPGKEKRIWPPATSHPPLM